jgi:hypothetical protein
MTPAYFCTLFDRNYLLKGLAMLRSLNEHCRGAHTFVLCMDEDTFSLLAQLQIDGVELIRLRDVEDEPLRAAKRERSRAEYCWTLTPVLPHFVLNTRPEVRQITYLDADLMFYSPVSPIFQEVGAASIAVVEHRYVPRLAYLEVQGRFNVEWVTFRRDAEGMACIERWKAQCLEWCFARIEPDRMGDQKYLDEWPERYRSLHIINHVGAGVAPWNFSRYRIVATSGAPTVDGEPLIFYHFHQLHMLRGGRFDRLSAGYRLDGDAPEAIYGPYESALLKALRDVRAIDPEFVSGIHPWLPVMIRRCVQNILPLRMKSALRRYFKP